MAVKLGIAGVPDEVDDTVALCERLGARPVFILGPGEALPPATPPSDVISLREWEPGTCRVALRGERLAGLWTATCAHGPAAAAVAHSLGLPHLPCLDDAQQASIPIAGAQVYRMQDLEQLGETELRALRLPAWVRAACTGGDGSCMRLDHTHDLSLAAAKLQKRNTGGPIRIQPVVEGPVYRLLAFKTGRELDTVDLIAEETTSSSYRVPLGMSMPVPRRGDLLERAVAVAREVNAMLPFGWGPVDMELVDTPSGLRLTDVQCPARLDRHLRKLVWLSQGVDLLRASLQCALGRIPQLAPTREVGVAMTWLLARSGRVIGFDGVEEARQMPGIIEVNIAATEGDTLGHVVDLPSRGRGGYVIASGATAAIAQARLGAARERIQISTSPALS